AQVLLEADRVHDVPPIHTESLLTPVKPVRFDDLGEAQERRRVDAVFPLWMLPVPGAAEVVLGARAADRGPLLVAVHVELDLTLTPPVVVVDAPGEVSADVMPLAAHPVEERVV